MSNSQTPENGGALATPNGADNGAWHTRVADLLDDVTVGAARGSSSAPIPLQSLRPRPRATAAAPWADAPLPPDPYEPPAWAIREVSPPRDVAPPVATPLLEHEPVATPPMSAPPTAAASESPKTNGPDRLPGGETASPLRSPAPGTPALSIRGSWGRARD